MKKRYLKPAEVEVIFEEARKKDADFYDGEKAIIQTVVNTAKRNTRIGDKIFLVIPPYYCHAPHWQRTTDVLHAKTIGDKYGSAQWDAPKVIFVNGKLIVVDGLHRLLGTLWSDKVNEVVVEVIDIPERDAIRIFLNQTKSKKNMTPSDCYPASIEYGDKDYIEFRNVCHAHNIQIKGDDSLEDPIGIFTAIKDGTRANKETLYKILTLINNLKWAGKETKSLTPSNAPYGSKVIRSINRLYSFYYKNEKDMEEALMDKCFGATYYQDNLAGKTQTRIFDQLDKEISEYLSSKAEIVPLKKGA